MGNGQSQQHFEDSPGYHVLRVSDNSPAEEAGLKSYFDFILSVNGVRLETDVAGTHLSEVLNHSVGETVVLNVYSSKERGIREVRVVPSKSWSLAETDGVIGAAVRFCSYGAAAENVWHILEVSPKSPAEKAGLQPNTDYVVGTPQMNLETQDDFFTLVEERQRAPIQLLVYNSQWDTCREVTIVPDSGWGGAGSLGCDIGYG
ncbi:MAG: GRASP55/65 PDZ-like domain-containing protein [Piptocephalis tieghemiana]|nr:MAG: GRASP55/65 PDZ-like domain-containing protein [Piptocephalis tieghemiana]